MKKELAPCVGSETMGSYPMLRFQKGALPLTRSDILIRERSVRLVLDDKEIWRTTLSPAMVREWALGYLFSQGFICRKSDVAEIVIQEDAVSVVRVDSRETSCSEAILRFPVRWDISFEIIIAGIAWIQEEPLYRATGAAHVVALLRSSGERLVRVADVGRHHATDKAIGWALDRAFPGEDLFAVTSGRLPEDMVLKYEMAGIPLVASVSAVTAEGVGRAIRAGMTLVGFCREGRMNIYSGAERIILPHLIADRKA